ncbi:ATP-binding cassette domain-containing protein [Pelagibaculum spongiae]|nr:ABC transporter ATP-binding protein [Pelagibaculum spongiae]
MNKLLVRLYQVIEAEQKKHVWILLVLMVLTSVTELAGIGAIVPLMMVASYPEKINDFGLLIPDWLLVGNNLLIVSGAIFLVFIVISNLVQIFTQFFLNRFSQGVASKLGNRLLVYYLHQPLVFHLNSDSKQLQSYMINELDRVGTNIIAPALRFFSRVISIALVSAVVFVLSPIIAISLMAVLVGAYWLIFRVLRGRAENNGREISRLSTKRIQYLIEGFEGIRELLIYQKQQLYTDSYAKTNLQISRSQADNLTLGFAPHYLVELVALVGMLVITLSFMISMGGIVNALPWIAFYAMAAFRLIPAFQQAYLALASMRGSQASLELLIDDLEKSKLFRPGLIDEVDVNPINVIQLKNMDFSFNGEFKLFSKLNYSFFNDGITLLKGPSGLGKSTLANLIMGLLKPDSGEVQYDQQPSAYGLIGLVPQHVFLLNATVEKNIAFGKKIDPKRISWAIKMAEIDFLSQDGAQQIVEDSGKNFSGGQRQRLGLARALYQEHSWLVLDEATSALDADLEEKIIASIQSYSKNHGVIVISHSSAWESKADKILDLQQQHSEPAS